MNQRPILANQLQRWTSAGLMDSATAAKILSFEAAEDHRSTLRWPVFLAMTFGGMLLAAGATLFVAAHWSELSPTARFSLLLFMVAAFHAGGTLLSIRFPAMSTTLHAVGTITLGAAIFLTAQIFNLHQNWATGVLLWAIGAAFGYALIRDWIQLATLALLLPSWLISQWSITTEFHSGGDRALAVGLILTATTYFSARIADQQSPDRRTLVWIGGIALLPSAGTAIAIALEERFFYANRNLSPLPFSTLLLGWIIALGAPLILAWFLRGRAAMVNFLWAPWAYAVVLTAAHSQYFTTNEYHRSLAMTLALYALCAIGAVGLVLWGLSEKRKERVNVGILAFAVAVLFFYFDSFMGKLGRSASLLLLGVLCLAGGYALEVTRRKLMAKMEVAQ
jgi:uncharacterized membrane protein